VVPTLTVEKLMELEENVTGALPVPDTTCGVVAERVSWRKSWITIIDIEKGFFELSPVAIEIAEHAG
jgi:hypothetical protein